MLGNSASKKNTKSIQSYLNSAMSLLEADLKQAGDAIGTLLERIAKETAASTTFTHGQAYLIGLLCDAAQRDWAGVLAEYTAEMKHNGSQYDTTKTVLNQISSSQDKKSSAVLQPQRTIQDEDFNRGYLAKVKNITTTHKEKLQRIKAQLEHRVSRIKTDPTYVQAQIEHVCRTILLTNCCKSVDRYCSKLIEMQDSLLKIQQEASADIALAGSYARRQQERAARRALQEKRRNKNKKRENPRASQEKRRNKSKEREVLGKVVPKSKRGENKSSQRPRQSKQLQRISMQPMSRPCINHRRSAPVVNSPEANISCAPSPPTAAKRHLSPNTSHAATAASDKETKKPQNLQKQLAQWKLQQQRLQKEIAVLKASVRRNSNPQHHNDL